MPNCAVYGCDNYSKKTKGTDIKYFSFPKDDELMKNWLAACKRKDKVNVKHARICSMHFSPSSFAIPLRQQLLKYTTKNSRNLKLDAVPTEKLPKAQATNATVTSREKRAKEKARKEEIETIVKDHVSYSQDNHDIVQVEPIIITEKNEKCELEELQNKIKELEKRNVQLSTSYEEMKIENKRLQIAQKNIPETITNILGHIFTPGQIKKLLNPGLKCVRWSTEDIAAAISLRSVSAKAYRYLRKHKYPFPALSTLRQWALSVS